MTKTVDIGRKMAERGIFTDDKGGFKSDKEIKREAALNGELYPIYKDGVVRPKTLHDYIYQAEERKKSMIEMSEISKNYLNIELPESSILVFTGDWHYGDLQTKNERILQEIEAVKNSPNTYIVLLGDLLNGIFWGGESQSEEVSNMNEQRGFIKAVFKELKGKILWAHSGEHDSKWAAKTGADPYTMLIDEAGAPYIRGVGEIVVNIGDQEYKIVSQHKASGHSMYNKNHPTYKEARFTLQNSDIYVSAHNHQKQVSQEAIRKFGNQSSCVTHIAIGPYKTKDSYGDRSGFVPQTEEQMYGVAVKLHKRNKIVELEPDILRAIERWT